MYGSRHHRDLSSPVCTLKLLYLLYTAPIVASSPMRAPAHQSSTSTSTSVGSSRKDKHTNLILVLGIGSGIVIIAIVSILIICSCVFREGKPKASPKETGRYSKYQCPHIQSLRFILGICSFFLIIIASSRSLMGPIRFSLDCEKFLSLLDLYTRNADILSNPSSQSAVAVSYAAFSLQGCNLCIPPILH